MGGRTSRDEAKRLEVEWERMRPPELEGEWERMRPRELGDIRRQDPQRDPYRHSLTVFGENTPYFGSTSQLGAKRGRTTQRGVGGEDGKVVTSRGYFQ